MRRSFVAAVLVCWLQGCEEAPESPRSAAVPGDHAPVQASRDRTAPATSPPPTHSELEQVDPPKTPDGMVYVPGGTFAMGPPRAPTHARGPVRVTVAPFFLDRTEVSVAAYRACVDEGRCSLGPHARGCNATAKKPLLDHPMNCVSKEQAEQFCGMHGKRLPSSPEWEFAARGTDGRIYPWGNTEPDEKVCWQGRAGAEDQATCPVGSFPQGASPFGALDLAGNVAEWTTTEESETAAPGGFWSRGGSYVLDDMQRIDPEFFMIRADQHETFAATDAVPRLGFRCARSR